MSSYLANHGTVSYGETVERAYWWTEILDAYCRILMMARDLGKINYFTEGETRELLDLKQKWGFKDPRLDQMENCDICANDIFRDSWKSTGVERRAFEPPPTMKPARTPSTNESTLAASGVDQESLVKLITDRVLAALAK